MLFAQRSKPTPPKAPPGSVDDRIKAARVELIHLIDAADAAEAVYDEDPSEANRLAADQARERVSNARAEIDRLESARNGQQKRLAAAAQKAAEKARVELVAARRKHLKEIHARAKALDEARQAFISAAIAYNEAVQDGIPTLADATREALGSAGLYVLPNLLDALHEARLPWGGIKHSGLPAGSPGFLDRLPGLDHAEARGATTREQWRGIALGDKQ